MTVPAIAPSDFGSLGISARLLKILELKKLTTPTPIQHQSIPAALQGKDVLGIAQTGTGKTLAFGLPLIQRLDTNPGNALIILPTRELALQVGEALTPFCHAFDIRTAVLIGGIAYMHQMRDLQRKPRLIIATPGRLVDFMEQRKIDLSQTSILVLDEADRMFDMGFAPQLTKIFKAMPKQKQTLLFSATMPPTVLKLATVHMTQPLRIEVAPAGTAATNIEQEIFIIHRDAKLSLLERLLQDSTGTVLVFSRTKHGAKKITATLRLMGHKAAEIHANRSQAQRREALEGFKTGRYRILVATDIAARGIDVTGIASVINFDLPDNLDDYVHRIGRTGRAGLTGKAISFATPDQRGDIRGIEKIIRKNLTISKLPELPPHAQQVRYAHVEDDIDPRSRPTRRPPSRQPFRGNDSRPAAPKAKSRGDW